MANTYTLIQSVTVGSGGTASIEFGSIPQTYTDLLVVTSIKGVRPGSTNSLIIVRFNGSTTSFTNRNLFGNGASVVSQTNTATFDFLGNGSAATASVFGSASIYIPNYTSSNYKSSSVDAVTENNATSAYQLFNAGLWSNTAAITSIEIAVAGDTTSIVQYSSASLYGIKSS